MTTMKTKYQLFLWLSAVCLTLLSVACKPKSVFLESDRILLDTANISLQQIQFYNDKDIILRHKKTDEPFVSELGGKLIEVDGEAVYQVVIKKGTPCIVSGIQNGKLLVRFERGDRRVLAFYKNSKGAYQIDALKWLNRKGLIKYAGLDFVIDQRSNDVLLMYKQTKRFKSSATTKTVKGVPVRR